MDYVLSILPYLMKGLEVSIKLWAGTICLSLPLAIFAAIGKISGPPALKRILGFYTWFFRGSPLMLQLFFAYFALPYIGIKLEPFAAAVITFILNATAYQTEIIRSGIEAVPKGQSEAAKALGFTYWQAMFKVILPQIWRQVLPVLTNEVILVFKDTALLAAIAMGDLLRAARDLMSRQLKVTPLLVALVIYLVIVAIIVYGSSRLEKKISVYI